MSWFSKAFSSIGHALGSVARSVVAATPLGFLFNRDSGGDSGGYAGGDAPPGRKGVMKERARSDAAGAGVVNYKEKYTDYS